MRFHIGPPPPHPNFAPEQEGWKPIREPGPWLLQLLALPISIASAVIFMLAWWFLLRGRIGTPGPLAVGLVLFGVIQVHELLHTAIHPGQGSGLSSIIGIWPSRLLFYAHYLEAMTRERFLLVIMAPLFVLSLLPLPVCIFVGYAPGFVVLTSVLNAFLSCGDLLAFALVAVQIPRGAIVRNQGYATWWTIPGSGHEERSNHSSAD